MYLTPVVSRIGPRGAGFASAALRRTAFRYSRTANVQICKCANVRMSKCANVRMTKCADIQMGMPNANVRICGCPNIKMLTCKNGPLYYSYPYNAGYGFVWILFSLQTLSITSLLKCHDPLRFAQYDTTRHVYEIGGRASAIGGCPLPTCVSRGVALDLW